MEEPDEYGFYFTFIDQLASSTDHLCPNHAAISIFSSNNRTNWSI